MRTCAAVLTALSLLLGVVGPARAGDATDRVRAFFAGVNRVIADSSYDVRPDARLAALRRLVADVVDFRSAAAIALGSEWAARSSGEREDFVRMFTALLETSVFASVGSRARLANGITVSYVAEVADGESATVATTVLTRSDRELSVDYRMTRRQGRWVVQDVWLDGVSLVENYRAQFQKVMQRSSYAELVAEMRARTVELGRPVAPVSVATAPAPVAAAAPVVPVSGVRATPSERMELMAAEHRSTVPAWDFPRTAVVAVPSVAVLGYAISRAHEPAVTNGPVEAPRRGPPARLAASSEPPRLSQVSVRRIETIAEPPRVAALSDAPRAATPTKQFWVQVGAFRSEEKAIRVATALRDQTVSLFTAPNDPLLRVLVGPFASRDAATSKLREIRARGYDAFIPAATN